MPVDKPFKPQMAAEKIERIVVIPNDFNAIVKRNYKIDDDSFTDDICYYLKQEKTFDSFVLEPGEASPEVPKGLKTRVGRWEMVCPVCNGHGEVRLNSVGQVTGLRIFTIHDCSCVFLHRYCKFWFDPNVVPLNYQHVTINNLAEFDDSRFNTWKKYSKLDKLIGTLRDNLDRSFLFTGAAGTGKTTCLLALYQNALFEECKAECATGNMVERLWKAGATKLSEQQADWKNTEVADKRSDDGGKPTNYPTVTPDSIRWATEAHLRPRLFLEEFDKFRMSSDFQREKFHDLMSAIDDGKGQVVATSNLSRKELVWDLGKSHGESILRRIVGAPIGIEIDFDSGSIIKSFDSLKPQRKEKTEKPDMTAKDQHVTPTKGEGPRITKANEGRPTGLAF